MFGILYIIIAWFTGYCLINGLILRNINFSSMKSLYNKPVSIPNWMIKLPAAFLTGTLLMSWFTYITTWLVSYFAPQIAKPLIYGNVATFAIFLFLASLIIYKNRKIYSGWKKRWSEDYKFKQLMVYFGTCKLEIIYVSVICIVWTIFMIRSLYVRDGALNIGISVFSDFGATLPIIRSFSFGSNFPTDYPHYAGVLSGINDIRYHFLFQFLAGNLEFLGLRLDWAFNLPSIISIVAFLMLLYSLAVLITGKKAVGIITSFLFFFRSSFAFFTFASDLKASGSGSVGEIFNAVLNNSEKNIGKTVHEDWGFWSQKVFVNKRHFSFTLGIVIFVLILMLPLFKEMIFKIKALRKKKQNIIKEFLFSKDAWLHSSIIRPVAAGLILGLIGFWNGATLIAFLPVLFFLAIFSRHRLEFLYTALIAVALSFAQTKFFMGVSPGIKPEIFIGFISPDTSLLGIIKYYIELLGMLPLLLVISLFSGFRGRRWLTLCFVSPVILATVLKFSVDVGANHVIVIFSVILLNIIVADFLHVIYEKKDILLSVLVLLACSITFILSADVFGFKSLYTSLIITMLLFVAVSIIILCFYEKSLIAGLKSALSSSAVIIIVCFLTITGFVDMATLYNMDKRVGTQYSMNDGLITWVKENSEANDIFLINPNFTHPVLMAGRKVFLGGAYFTWTAGYDTNVRAEIVKRIYGGTDINDIKRLLNEYKIRFISVDNGNRMSQDYIFNETIFNTNFEKVFSGYSDVVIYKVY